jgi:hypothetical protein
MASTPTRSPDELARRRWLALFPLGGVLSALAWRGEIEWHGWASLEWLEWFHWALPLGLGLFIASAVAVVRAARPDRSGPGLAVLALALALFAVAGLVFTDQALRTTFSRMAFLGDSGVRVGLLVGLAAIPVFLALVLVPLGAWPGWGRLGAAVGVWLVAMPIVTVPTDANFVDAIKRGWPVPLLYVALGLLFWPPKPAPPPSSS